jgi:PleD family two-component response regulator
MRIYFAHGRQDANDDRLAWLEAAGYEVTLLKGSLDLGVAMRSGEPDLLLLDVLIDGQNGFATARDVNLKFPERDFPIVLCSRIYRGRQFSAEAQRSGVQTFILLPKPEKEFIRRIRQTLTHFSPPDDLDVAA